MAERSDVEPDQDEVGGTAVTGVVEIFWKEDSCFFGRPTQCGAGERTNWEWLHL